MREHCTNSVERYLLQHSLCRERVTAHIASQIVFNTCEPCNLLQLLVVPFSRPQDLSILLVWVTASKNWELELGLVIRIHIVNGYLSQGLSDFHSVKLARLFSAGIDATIFNDQFFNEAVSLKFMQSILYEATKKFCELNNRCPS